MEREDAERVMKHLEKALKELNVISEISTKIKDVGEGKKIRKALANVWSTCHLEIMFPIIRDYPELDPDRSPS